MGTGGKPAAITHPASGMTSPGGHPSLTRRYGHPPREAMGEP